MTLSRLRSTTNGSLTSDLAHSAWLGVDQEQDAADAVQELKDTEWDWLIVDHYALDSRWESEVRGVVDRVMVVDDIADRRHRCDLLLDQNLGKGRSDYRDLLIEPCTELFGPMHALLAPAFSAARTEALRSRAERRTHNILITMGGMDKDNVTASVVRTLPICSLPADTSFTIVMGGTAPWISEVRELAAKLPWPTTVIVGAKNMAQLMTVADLAIGAAGSTSWERCCLGLPTILMVLAENQRPIAAALKEQGAAVVVDHLAPDADLTLRHGVEELMRHHGKLMAISQAAARVTDGGGVARVQEAMERSMLGNSNKRPSLPV